MARLVRCNLRESKAVHSGGVFLWWCVSDAAVTVSVASSLRKQGPIATVVNLAKSASSISSHREHNAVWVPGRASLARDDGGGAFDAIVKQREGMRPHCRGAMRPSFASIDTLENKRAQGKPDARCTRGLVCKCTQQKRTRAYRFSGGTPAFPAQWFTAYFVLSPVTGFVATVTRVKFCFPRT